MVIRSSLPAEPRRARRRQWRERGCEGRKGRYGVREGGGGERDRERKEKEVEKEEEEL